MEIKDNKVILDNLELRALASVGAMALGNKKLSELLLKNQFELKKLNGEIRESCKKLCPDCNQPYITYTSEEHYECNSCGCTWT